MNGKLVSYDFPTAEVYGVNEKLVQSMKLVDGISTTMTMTAIPVTLGAGELRVDLASIRQVYDGYRRQSVQLLVGELISKWFYTTVCGERRMIMITVLLRGSCYLLVRWFRPRVTTCSCPSRGLWSFCTPSPVRFNQGAASGRLRYSKWIRVAPDVGVRIEC